MGNLTALVPYRATLTARRLLRPSLHLVAPLARLARQRLRVSELQPIGLELELVGPVRGARGRRFRTEVKIAARVTF